MFEHLLARTRRYWTSLSWLVAILETAMALLAGGLIGATFSGRPFALWAIAALLLYLVFFAVKLYGQKLFPTALFGELEAQETLRRREAELQRRDRLFSYLDASIERLNQKTCDISQRATDQICDEAAEVGLSALIEPIISRPHYVLACDSSRFTVAARIGHSKAAAEGETTWVEYFVVFRDDLALRDNIVAPEGEDDAFTDLGATGIRLQLRNVMHFAYNHNKYHAARIEHEGRRFTVVVAPIPLVCETPEAGGVLLLVTDTEIACPCDMPDVLRIYGRLVANWLAKYSDCIQARANYVPRYIVGPECCAVEGSSEYEEISTTTTTPGPE